MVHFADVNQEQSIWTLAIGNSATIHGQLIVRGVKLCTKLKGPTKAPVRQYCSGYDQTLLEILPAISDLKISSLFFFPHSSIWLETNVFKARKKKRGIEVMFIPA